MKLKQLDLDHFKKNLKVYENGNGKFQVSIEMGNRHYKCLVSTNVIYINKTIHTVRALAATVNDHMIPCSKLVIMKGLSVELFIDGIEGVDNTTLFIADSIFEASQISRMIGSIPHQLIIDENYKIDFSQKLVVIPYVYCDFDSLRTRTFYRTIYSVKIANLVHCKSRFVYCLIDSRNGMETWRYTFQTMILCSLQKPYVHFYERYQKCPCCREQRDTLLLFNCRHYCCRVCMIKIKDTQCFFCSAKIINVEYIDDEIKPHYSHNTIVFKDNNNTMSFEKELTTFQKNMTRVMFSSLSSLQWCDVTNIEQVIVYCDVSMTAETIQKIFNIFCILKPIILRVAYSNTSVLKLWEERMQENWEERMQENF